MRAGLITGSLVALIAVGEMNTDVQTRFVTYSLPSQQVDLTPATGGDDAESLQRAIDSVPARGGVVHLAAGVYHLKVKDGVRALSPRPHVEIVGDGQDRTKLIVEGDPHGYVSVFYRAQDSDEDVSGFGLRELTIDQNTGNNPITSAASLVGKPRAILTVFAGSGIRVENCRFTSVAGTNALVFNGRRVSDVRITNNNFDEVGNTVATHYDHSTIYAHGDRFIISGNTFRARLEHGGTFGATTAIETHGSEYIVTNNIVTGYLQGMNITGVADASHNIVVTENTLTAAAIGIQLWSNFYGSNTTRPALANVSITGNVMTLDRTRWVGAVGSAALVTAGIIVNARSDSPIDQLRIDGNIISFGESAAWSAVDAQSAGVEMWLVDTSVTSRNIAVTNNQITGAYGPGIRLSMAADNVAIAGNQVRNTGRARAAVPPPFRSAVMVSHHQHGLMIHHNQFVDDQESGTLTFGIYNSADTASRSLRAENNALRVATGTPTPFESAAGAAPFFISFEGDDLIASPTYPVVAGSTIKDVVQGRMRTQVATPAGTLWRTETYAAEAPTTGTWAVGDIVYNVRPIVGESIGWTCVQSGTPGVFVPFGLIPR